MTAQISSLLRELPEHTETVKAKVKSLKHLAGGSGRIAQMIEEVKQRAQGRARRTCERPPIARPTAEQASVAGAAQSRDPRAAKPALAGTDHRVPLPAAGISGRARAGDHPGDLHAAEARGISQPRDQARRPWAHRRRHQVRRRGRPANQPFLAHASDRQRRRSGWCSASD